MWRSGKTKLEVETKWGHVINLHNLHRILKSWSGDKYGKLLNMTKKAKDEVQKLEDRKVTGKELRNTKDKMDHLL